MAERSKSKVKFGIHETNSTSQNVTNIQQNLGRTSIDSTSSSRLKKGGGSGRSNQNISDDEIYVETLLKEVFFDASNQSQITQNLRILKESRFAKAFVTFKGGDVKKPDEKLKFAMTATFGVAGYEVYKMILRLINVSYEIQTDYYSQLNVQFKIYIFLILFTDSTFPRFPWSFSTIDMGWQGIKKGI